MKRCFFIEYFIEYGERPMDILRVALENDNDEFINMLERVG